nr:DNA-directed DNA polymerase [Tanacetum cinerariifolium]
YKDLLRACPHHGFTELHQLDTFYNALNPAYQDSLNAAAGGNLLERRTQDVLTIIKNKSKVRNSRNKSVVSQVKSCDANSNSSSEIAKLTHAVNQQMSVVTTAMTAILKQFQATPTPASVKAVEEICVTCGGAHPYYQCLAASGNTFLELWDNIQGYVSAAAVNYNQGNFIYHPPDSLSNQANEIKNMMASLFQMNTASTSGSGSLPSNIIANPKGELKAITTRSGLVLDGPTVPTPPLFINPEEDECVEETLTDPDLSKYTIKKLGLPELISTCMTLELANRAICTPAGIARDVFVSVGKFTFPADFVIVDYESDPKVPFIIGRPFLWTARALIDVHGEEMILRDGDERLTLNMRHDTSSYSNEPQKESINLINFFNNPKGGNVLAEKLLDLDSTKDLHPPLHSDLKEIEFLVHRDIDSSLKDSIDESNLDNPADNFVDSMPEMFTDEHALDYSSPPIFDEYDDDFLEVESDTEMFMMILSNPRERKSKSILIQEKPFEIITRVVQDKKLAISNASLVLEDFDPPLYEPLFFKEVPRLMPKDFVLQVFISLASLRNHESSFLLLEYSVSAGKSSFLLVTYSCWQYFITADLPTWHFKWDGGVGRRLFPLILGKLLAGDGGKRVL